MEATEIQISDDVKSLQQLMPTAIIKEEVDWDNIKLKVRIADITPQQNIALKKPIKELFGNRFIKRDCMYTGVFTVFLRLPIQ